MVNCCAGIKRRTEVFGSTVESGPAVTRQVRHVKGSSASGAEDEQTLDNA